ncbi:hypothetical protein NBRC116598_18650 [Pseudophaeobacter arcticus]|uniref:Secreted protein n=1 Tax=Pseudophaeobacter arcticus TaxID=385492 RepID=A0ABQ0AKM1_9RHOB
MGRATVSAAGGFLVFAAWPSRFGLSLAHKVVKLWAIGVKTVEQAALWPPRGRDRSQNQWMGLCLAGFQIFFPYAHSQDTHFHHPAHDAPEDHLS